MVKKVKEKRKLEKGGFSWKNFSLSGRISSILCISMVVVFLLMNVVILGAAGRSFENVNQAYLQSTTSMHVEKVKKSITDAERAARAVEDHLETMYSDTDNAAASVPSVVKDSILLTPTRSYEERYLLDSVWEMIRHNENIMGAGVFFEPNAFQENMPCIWEEIKETKISVSLNSWITSSMETAEKSTIQRLLRKRKVSW